MTDELQSAFRVLEVTPETPLDEARSHYLDRVKAWHPDRYTYEPVRLKILAEEKLREVNAAWQKVEAILKDRGPKDLIPMDFGGSWGFVDPAGNVLIAPQFVEVRPFSEGYAAVRMTEKWGFVDNRGNYAVHPTYDECGDFSEGLCAVKWYGRWGFINSNDKMVIRPQFQEVKAFHGGLADVRLGPRWGKCDREGQVTFLNGAQTFRLEA